jgi:hypothetical protein
MAAMSNSREMVPMGASIFMASMALCPWAPSSPHDHVTIARRHSFHYLSGLDESRQV